MKKKTVYVAFDGKEFSKMTECELYEERKNDCKGKLLMRIMHL